MQPDLKALFQKIDSLRDELSDLMPLKKEDEDRLWRKFRLEWNYNSNHLEGNTLTYGQTELLLIFDKTTGDHYMREYEEMKAHDVAVKLIQDYARDQSRELTEADIREFDKIILVRPYWGYAITSDGQPTRKLIQPGEYKKEPNSVRLANGEVFNYTSPEDTPIKMSELIHFFRDSSKNKVNHPLLIAGQLHYDFVRIHPFDDSNGRTSRLLMNYVLLKNGYPPVIIRSADKKNYLAALNKADVGLLNDFIYYIGEHLVWSLNVNIRAAKGENIEDEDDIDKELEILKRERGEDMKKAIPKSIEALSDLLTNSFLPLIEQLLNRHKKLSDFFLTNHFNVFVENRGGQDITDFKQAGDYLSQIMGQYKNETLNSDFVSHTNAWSLQVNHANLKTTPNQESYVNRSIEIKLYPFRYEITYKDKELFKKPYSHQLTKDEINSVVNLIVREIMDLIKDSDKK